jgi:hypothetical protein
MKNEIKKPKKKIVTKEATAVCEESCCCEKPSKKLKLHLIGFLALLTLFSVCFYKYGIVATVNGTPIYRFEYIKQLQKADTTVISQMVQEALIKGEAKNKGIVISQDEIDKSMTVIEDQVKQQGTTLDEALKSRNITKEQLQDQIRTQLTAEKMASPSAEATQEEVDKFLKDNKDYLPTDKTATELQLLAKEQIEAQAKDTALNTWYSNLETSAKIIYR